MKLSESIKPISYLKAHASEIIRDVNENGKTLIITQNGEAKVVVQDIKEYEKLQDKLAFLQLVELSREQVRQGKTKSLDRVKIDLDKKINELKKRHGVQNNTK